MSIIGRPRCCCGQYLKAALAFCRHYIYCLDYLLKIAYSKKKYLLKDKSRPKTQFHWFETMECNQCQKQKKLVVTSCLTWFDNLKLLAVKLFNKIQHISTALVDHSLINTHAPYFWVYTLLCVILRLFKCKMWGCFHCIFCNKVI